MITKILYICEYCGTKYSSETAAKDCESFHMKILKIVDARYVSSGQGKKAAMPITITVEDENGEKVIYKR